MVRLNPQIDHSDNESNSGEDSGDEGSVQTHEGSQTMSSVPTSSFGEIPTRTGIDESTLRQYFDIDPEGNEPPYLNFDPEVLEETGTSRSEKQMRGSLIILTLRRECTEAEQVMSPDLKDALRVSGIDDTELSNMYQFNDGEGDRYFRRDGSGANTEISLTLPGTREGYDQIQRTIEQLVPGENS